MYLVMLRTSVRYEKSPKCILLLRLFSLAYVYDDIIDMTPKSRFKVHWCADRRHSLNQDFTVLWTPLKLATLAQLKVAVLTAVWL